MIRLPGESLRDLALILNTEMGVCDDVGLIHEYAFIGDAFDDVRWDLEVWWCDTFIGDPEAKRRVRRVLHRVDVCFSKLAIASGRPIADAARIWFKREMLGAMYASPDAIAKEATGGTAEKTARVLLQQIEAEAWHARSSA